MKSWIKERIKPNEIDRYMTADADFIDDSAIEALIDHAPGDDPARIRDIIAKARAIENLTAEETAALLNVEDPDLWREMEAVGW